MQKKAPCFLIAMLAVVVLCYCEAHSADILPDIFHVGGIVTVEGCDTKGIGGGVDVRGGWWINKESLPQIILWGHIDNTKLYEGLQVEQGGAGTSLVFPSIIKALRMDLHINTFADAGKIYGGKTGFATLTGGGLNFFIAETAQLKTHLPISVEYSNVGGINFWSIRAGLAVEVK